MSPDALVGGELERDTAGGGEGALGFGVAGAGLDGVHGALTRGRGDPEVEVVGAGV